MIDTVSFARMVPGAFHLLSPPPATEQLDDVPATGIHFCAPTVLGYSFVTKTWGRFNVEKFTPIKWNENAITHLVLSEAKKKLIRSVVHADRSRLITDVVSRKSGGFIVILHGKPGTGKTLTAEAAADEARKPLMVLSAAELGYKADEVEVKLRSILDLCKEWNAILLIDEAEVFLESRSLGDVPRNSIVSAFLRLFEYHQQVIFLTTNHITRLDTAFKSRIAVAVKYPDLDKAAQEEIWERFLKLADVQILDSGTERESFVTKVELEKLSRKKLNGRLTVILGHS